MLRGVSGGSHEVSNDDPVGGGRGRARSWPPAVEAIAPPRPQAGGSPSRAWCSARAPPRAPPTRTLGVVAGPQGDGAGGRLLAHRRRERERHLPAHGHPERDLHARVPGRRGRDRPRGGERGRRLRGQDRGSGDGRHARGHRDRDRRRRRRGTGSTPPPTSASCNINGGTSARASSSRATSAPERSRPSRCPSTVARASRST